MNEKQTNYVRTQVRLPKHLHQKIKEYAEENNLSLNAAFNNLVANGWLEYDDNLEKGINRGEAYAIIETNAEYLSIKQLRLVSDMILEMLRDKPRIPKGGKFGDV